MHAPDGSCRKPAGARAPVTGGTDGHRARAPRPTAEVAAARPQANPDVGGGACPPAGIGAPPWRGAPQPGRRGPPSGAGRDAATRRRRMADAGTRGRRRERGRWLLAFMRLLYSRLRESAGDGHGATNSRPQGAARETEGRMGGQWNDWTRAEAPTRTSAGRGAKGARASAALWQRARPPR